MLSPYFLFRSSFFTSNTYKTDNMLNEYKIKVLTNTNQNKPIAITVFTENILTEKNLNDLSEMTLDEV